MSGPVGDLERYRTLVETVGDPMYMLDADGYVTKANRALALAVGYDDPAAVEGTHVSTFVSDAHVARGTDVLLDLVDDDDREWASFEMDVLTVDGEAVRAEDKVAPLTDDGDLVGSVGVIRDVSDRTARERELRALTTTIERLQSFTADLQSTGSADAVYELVVEAAEDVIGLDWSAVAIAEDGWFELKAVSEDAPLSVGERHLRVDEGLAGATLADGRPSIVDDLHAHEDGRPADPSFRSALSVPIGDRGVFQANNSEPGAFDESDLELVEILVAHAGEALARIDRERELRQLTDTVEQLHQATTVLQSCTTPAEVYDIVVDAAETILAFDWSTVAIAEDGWLELTAVSADAPIDAGGRHLQVDEGVAGEVYQSGESVLIATPDDHPSAEPVDDSFTANLTVPLGDHGVFQANAAEAGYFDREDVELAELLAAHAGEALGRIEREQQLRDREAELRRQNERLDRFASAVSHDLRNPLNVAQGHLARVDDESVAEATDALDRMEAIIGEVLELARQGRTIDDPGPVELGAVARAAWRGVDTGDAGLAVDPDGTLSADEDRLRRLLENLFRNAADHGGAGAVRVGIEGETLVVADDGSGIPADERDRVFERGYTTSDDGTGFGLAIVDEIAGAHGWDASVTESADSGARFEFDGVERPGTR